MAINPTYKNNGDGAVEFDASRNQLPLISEKLDSVRAYQWEIHFFDVPNIGDTQDFTLAAKQVTQTGMQVEDIEVNRVNDKVYYPGKPSADEVVVTFDNLLNQRTAVRLWEWFKNIYDPQTGEMTRNVDYLNQGGNFKSPRVEIVELDNKLQPIASTILIGVYPKSYKDAERNYSTNEMHTIEMTFRYDFLDRSTSNLLI